MPLIDTNTPATDTIPAPVWPVHPIVLDPVMPASSAAFNDLATSNIALSVTVLRDHATLFSAATGFGTGWQPITTDTPMVLASVSKLITSLTLARLAETGLIDIEAPVPWDLMAVAHDPGWNDVSVRELLQHSSGMPKMQESWFDEPGSCAIPLTEALSRPPTMTRSRWWYSNGNYCALGLLIESLTASRFDHPALRLVFEPIGITGPHLTVDGALDTDGPYPLGVGRLERLGAAGTWLASSDDVAAMLDSVTPDDLATMTHPAIMFDQYGWGHTGTVDGAKACAWVIDQGRTIVVGIVAGNRPDTGGRLCDRLIPAVAHDLGIWAGEPYRFPK